MTTFTKHILICLGILFLAAMVSKGQERAMMPYRQIIKMAQSKEGDKKVDSYQMNISTTLDLPPEKIELVIDTEEPEYLIVDNKGRVKIPYREELMEKNPVIISNVPRGTLNVSFTIEAPPFSPPKIVDGKIKYKALFQPVLEIQNHVRKIDPTFGLMGKDQFALKIVTDQPLKIIRESGPSDKRVSGSRTYRPKNGVIYLFMEPYMFKDDPIVEIPGKVTIELKPFSADVAEKIKSNY